MEKDARIYIAGHLGMVGSALLRNLRNKGYHRFILRDLRDLDLTRQQEVEAFFEQEKPEYVFVAAAKVGGILANNTYRAQFLYENLMIQSNIIHAAYRSGVKKLLFLGSSCIYPKLAPQPLKEEYLLNGILEPTNEPYAIAKITGIKLCENYYRQYGCNFLSVMPTNLYGPNDNYNLETSHVMPALIRKTWLAHCLMQGDWSQITADLAKRPVENVTGDAPKEVILDMLEKYGIARDGSSLQLWGTGSPLREFLHVDDMADACVFVMEQVDAAPLSVGNEFFHFLNIGSGSDLSIRELAGLIQQTIGYTGKLDWDPAKPDGTPRKLMDVSRLSKLGWNYSISLKEGIQKVFNDYIS